MNCTIKKENFIINFIIGKKIYLGYMLKVS